MKLPQEPGLPSPPQDGYLPRLAQRLTDLFRFTHASLAVLTADVATNATAIAALPTVTAGVYTPTLTNVANVAASTASECQYLQVGNVVVVSGQLALDATAAGSIARVGISLPVASDFSSTGQCGGTAAYPINAGAEAFGISADVTNKRASMSGNAATALNHTIPFSFTYQVV